MKSVFCGESGPAPGALHEDEPLPEEADWECPERDAELIYSARHVNEDEAPGESAWD